MKEWTDFRPRLGAAAGMVEVGFGGGPVYRLRLTPEVARAFACQLLSQAEQAEAQERDDPDATFEAA